mmetsp:Transcript_32518/g.114395  ORF Transcript_32518/g.114395 Transcript_32518/m.114395 type:complete len:392 (-) Transcript_32518:14-1189(-)
MVGEPSRTWSQRSSGGRGRGGSSVESGAGGSNVASVTEACERDAGSAPKSSSGAASSDAAAGCAPFAAASTALGSEAATGCSALLSSETPDAAAGDSAAAPSAAIGFFFLFSGCAAAGASSGGARPGAGPTAAGSTDGAPNGAPDSAPDGAPDGGPDGASDGAPDCAPDGAVLGVAVGAAAPAGSTRSMNCMKVSGSFPRSFAAASAKSNALTSPAGSAAAKCARIDCGVRHSAYLARPKSAARPALVQASAAASCIEGMVPCASTSKSAKSATALRCTRSARDWPGPSSCETQQSAPSSASALTRSTGAEPKAYTPKEAWIRPSRSPFCCAEPFGSRICCACRGVRSTSEFSRFLCTATAFRTSSRLSDARGAWSGELVVAPMAGQRLLS